MNDLYKSFFASYLTSEFANPQEQSKYTNGAYVEALTALYWALKGNSTNALNTLEKINKNSSETELPILEAKLMLMADRKPIGSKDLIGPIEEVIEKFPKAGFARMLKIEVLQQARQSSLVKELALEMLGDFPDAKWLNVFLVQANVFLKDYSSAANYAKKMPPGITRTLNLFWSKVWHPYIFFMPIFIFVFIFAVLEYLPAITLYLLAIVLPIMGTYLFRTRKDRITLTWCTALSIMLALSTFFLRGIID